MSIYQQDTQLENKKKKKKKENNSIEGTQTTE